MTTLKNHIMMNPVSAGRFRLPNVLVRRGITKSFSGRVLIVRRKYHDESFGFRKAREFIIPDCAYNI